MLTPACSVGHPQANFLTLGTLEQESEMKVGVALSIWKFRHFFINDVASVVLHGGDTPEHEGELEESEWRREVELVEKQLCQEDHGEHQPVPGGGDEAGRGFIWSRVTWVWPHCCWGRGPSCWSAGEHGKLEGSGTIKPWQNCRYLVNFKSPWLLL